MALRLIEMVVQERDGEEIRELLKEHKVLEHRHFRLPDEEVLLEIPPGRFPDRIEARTTCLRSAFATGLTVPSSNDASNRKDL